MILSIVGSLAQLPDLVIDKINLPSDTFNTQTYTLLSANFKISEII